MISTQYNQIPGYMDSKRNLYPEQLSPLRFNDCTRPVKNRQPSGRNGCQELPDVVAEMWLSWPNRCTSGRPEQVRHRGQVERDYGGAETAGMATKATVPETDYLPPLFNNLQDAPSNCMHLVCTLWAD